ncbi:YjcQ family protein [Levilactobacillus brevis]|uniref:YjcQ family protein n=1 Tax=Levilactobacillus brevis TaxID=1580 RepID=UPI0021A876F6|nr:YjcQ family protein [Levilactobacillus brevis]
MAKDDYFVVMYQLLKILYDKLKQGKSITDEEFNQLSYKLNENYWNYILINMANEGFISGVQPVSTLNGENIKTHNVQITPAGIEYLFSNSMMERVKNTLKDIKGIVPGM